jgi:hypothetical protein
MPYTREQLLQAHASARVYQERYDRAFQHWGMKAPEPVIGEPVDDYRRNLAVKAKRLLPDGNELKPVQFRALGTDTLDILEPRLLKECQEAAFRPDSVPPGEMRRVEKIDGNGLKIVEWIGQRSFIEDFKQIPRRVLGFRTDQGFMNTSGRFLR